MFMVDEDFVYRTKHLFNVAQGKEQAHLAVIQATLANVYTGEMLENQTICIWDKWIVYVGQNPGWAIGPDTEIIDAGEKAVIPGLVDAHTHISDWRYTPNTFLEHVIPGGTTAIVTETVEPYAVGGYEGVIDFMNSLVDQPIHFFGTAPPSISISPNFPPISLDHLQDLLSRSDIIGLGESFWQVLLNDSDRILPIFEAVLSKEKLLEGHSAGAADNKLNAYVAAGISSCHEPINAQEALDRLRLGLYVMIRQGSIRKDLQEIAALGRAEVDPRRLILVTDGMGPEDLLEKGYMEYVVQKAMDSGFTFMEAIQMATLNPATHFNLDHMIGGIAPGRYADLSILSDTSTIQPELVIGKGRIIARHGQCLTVARVHQFQTQSMDSVHLPSPFTAADFKIPINEARNKVTIRLIDMITDLVSAEAQAELQVMDGEIAAVPSQDIAKIAAINRTNNPGQIFVGLIRGFGIKSGAFASSSSWDLGNILVVGTSDVDMAEAVNRIQVLKGGVTVCRQGKIMTELSLPIMGLMTDLSIPDLVQSIDWVKASLQTLGVNFRNPILTLNTLTGAAIPFLRICEHGLVNLKSGPCSLIVSE